jgi:hypothetical protein
MIQRSSPKARSRSVLFFIFPISVMLTLPVLFSLFIVVSFRLLLICRRVDCGAALRDGRGRARVVGYAGGAGAVFQIDEVNIPIADLGARNVLPDGRVKRRRVRPAPATSA